MSRSIAVQRVTDLFDRELKRAEEDCESSTFIGWLESIEAEVLQIVEEEC